MGEKLDLGKLPRYRFGTHKPIGCQAHGLAECLCDVKITRITPAQHTPIFGELAATAVGGLSEETIADWAAILIGCHTKHLELEQEASTPSEYQKRNYGPGLGAWARLPEFNRLQLVKCYNRNVPWRDARVWVPSNFSKDEFKVVAKTYNVRLVTARRQPQETNK